MSSEAESIHINTSPQLEEIGQALNDTPPNWDHIDSLVRTTVMFRMGKVQESSIWGVVLECHVHAVLLTLIQSRLLDMQFLSEPPKVQNPQFGVEICDPVLKNIAISNSATKQRVREYDKVLLNRAREGASVSASVVEATMISNYNIFRTPRKKINRRSLQQRVYPLSVSLGAASFGYLVVVKRQTFDSMYDKRKYRENNVVLAGVPLLGPDVRAFSENIFQEMKRLHTGP